MPFVALVGLGAGRPPNVPFVVHQIDNGASETASVFDVDGDRRLDIVSGDFWYQAPAWTPHRFREIPFTSNYVDAFSDLAARRRWRRPHRPRHGQLVRQADRLVSQPGQGRSATAWADAAVDSGFPVEFAILADLDNDGRAREVLPQFGDAEGAARLVRGEERHVAEARRRARRASAMASAPATSTATGAPTS